MPLTLWLVEAVNNAFHHGFPDDRPGVVRAVFRVGASHAVLSVADNGIGFDSSASPSDQPGGYGLRLIKALAAQLGGTATVEARDSGGSLASLKFPRRPLVPPLEPRAA